jgi:spore germination protein PB
VHVLNFYVNQSIVINYIRIGGISNSAVFQIGSAGIIKPVSHLYNTGGFTGPAPGAKTATQSISTFVPLAAP